MPVRRSRGSRKKQNQVSGGAPPQRKTQYNIPEYGVTSFTGPKMGVHTEGGGIGFSFPRSDSSSHQYAWGKAGLFDTMSLYTNKYNAVAVGGRGQALLKILSEVEQPKREKGSTIGGKSVNNQYLKEKYFVPHQAHTVANISKEGVNKLIKPKTGFREAVKGLQSNGAVTVHVSNRKYWVKITPKGREILAILEDKYGDTRTGE